MNDPRKESVVDFLYREGALLDERRWDEWLELFAPNVEYWMPAWDSELEETADPETELSLIYYDSRGGLEDRVFRLKSGHSSASNPLPRTQHMLSNIQVEFRSTGECDVRACWQTHVYQWKSTSTFYGYHELVLEPYEQTWRIRKKKIHLLNDCIPTVIDICAV